MITVFGKIPADLVSACRQDSRSYTKLSAAHTWGLSVSPRPLEIVFLDQFKKLERVTIDVTHKADARRFTANDRAQDLLALDQRQATEVAAVQPENVKGVINGLS